MAYTRTIYAGLSLADSVLTPSHGQAATICNEIAAMGKVLAIGVAAYSG